MSLATERDCRLQRRCRMANSLEIDGPRFKRRFYAVIIVAVVIVFPIWWWCWFNPPTTILLVRHADKMDGDGNVNLSDDGKTRAEVLIDVANEAGVAAVYANQWCRTAQTAQPLADSVGHPLTVEQVSHADAGLGGCSPPITVAMNRLPPDIDTPAELIDHVLATHAGQVILIVGHSDTVPEMIEEIGQGAFAPIQIDHSEYDRLFVATTRRYFPLPKLIKAQYGN